MPDAGSHALRDRSRLYDEAAAAFGPALARLAVAYERDPHRRQDLLQDIHFALWRSLAAFDGRCALRTWVYRVAHNVATSHALRDRLEGTWSAEVTTGGTLSGTWLVFAYLDGRTEGDTWITSGTGKFEGATGWGKTTGTYEVGVGTENRVEGWIAY